MPGAPFTVSALAGPRSAIHARPAAAARTRADGASCWSTRSPNAGASSASDPAPASGPARYREVAAELLAQVLAGPE